MFTTHKTMFISAGQFISSGLKSLDQGRAFAVFQQTCFSLHMFFVISFMSVAVSSQAITEERKVELEYLLKQDCGSCHGLTLKGGLGPSLLPDALMGTSIQTISAIILHGRANTAMPPWSNYLTEEDAAWLAQRLLYSDWQGNRK